MPKQILVPEFKNFVSRIYKFQDTHSPPPLLTICIIKCMEHKNMNRSPVGGCPQRDISETQEISYNKSLVTLEEIF